MWTRTGADQLIANKQTARRRRGCRVCILMFRADRPRRQRRRRRRRSGRDEYECRWLIRRIDGRTHTRVSVSVGRPVSGEE